MCKKEDVRRTIGSLYKRREMYGEPLVLCVKEGRGTESHWFSVKK